MKRIVILVVLSFLFSAVAEKRPNILFIVTDDQDFAAIGAYGGNVPLIMRWPGTITPGSVSDAMIANVDFADTVLDEQNTLAADPEYADMLKRMKKQMAQEMRDMTRPFGEF